jgi:hypothetical protein
MKCPICEEMSTGKFQIKCSVCGIMVCTECAEDFLCLDCFMEKEDDKRLQEYMEG